MLGDLFYPSRNDQDRKKKTPIKAGRTGNIDPQEPLAGVHAGENGNMDPQASLERVCAGEVAVEISVGVL